MAPAFGEGNTALTLTVSNDALKRRKPKSNMVKSNSSFVSRVIPHDSLTKRLAERDNGGSFLFVLPLPSSMLPAPTTSGSGLAPLSK